MTTRRIRMSSKGQIVMPRELREKRGWHSGTILAVTETPHGLLVSSAATPSTDLDQLIGCVRYRGKRRSVADMERAVAREARRRGA